MAGSRGAIGDLAALVEKEDPIRRRGLGGAGLGKWAGLSKRWEGWKRSKTREKLDLIWGKMEVNEEASMKTRKTPMSSQKYLSSPSHTPPQPHTLETCLSCLSFTFFEEGRNRKGLVDMGGEMDRLEMLDNLSVRC